MKLKNIGLTVATLFFVFTLAAAAPANVDRTFGSSGRVVCSTHGSEITFGQDYALQTDGKIVAVGGGSNLGFLVARYNSNGSLDTGFGTNGWSSITFPDYSTSATAVDIQPDGKIVVGGNGGKFINNQWTYDFLIARFNADGSPDTTFDGDAKTIVSFVPEIITNVPAQENFRTLKTTSDGKIIAGGSAGTPGPGGNSRFTFARLSTNGSLDTTFDGDGKSLGVEGFMYLNDLTVLSDGSFIGVGSEPNNAVRLASKYNSNGSLVWSYSRGETLPGGTGSYGIAQQPDGKLIMVGNRRSRFNALRLNANGVEDSSFAAPFSPEGRLNSVAVQPDGKIVALLNSPGFNIVRYNSDGNFDTSFGSNGIFTAAVSGGSDTANKIIAQPDGKILVGGYSSLTNPTRYYFSMLRVLGNAVTRRTFYDYDGDSKADVSVYRPSVGTWYLNNSTSGFSATNFGISTDKIIPADYDGDGKTDVAVYRNGIWYVLQSFDNSFSAIAFGQSGDVPVPADYDGDGRTDQAVFRAGIWYLNRSLFGFAAISFGVTEDKPTAADYDGDGKTDVSVYRPSDGTWYRINSSNGSFTGVRFGIASDAPVAADYDGDGKADISVYRPASGDWYRLNSSNGSFYSVRLGLADDKPVAADYDGDGKADVAVFRPSQGTWYMNQSTAGFKAMRWGIPTDIPTPNAYIR